MFINVTPHEVTMYATTDVEAYDPRTKGYTLREGAQPSRIIPASGDTIRVSVQETLSRVVDGIEIYQNIYGALEYFPKGEREPQPMPQERPDVLYITSPLAANAAKAAGRNDCVAPNHTIRVDGKVIGCLALSEGIA